MFLLVGSRVVGFSIHSVRAKAGCIWTAVYMPHKTILMIYLSEFESEVYFFLLLKLMIDNVFFWLCQVLRDTYDCDLAITNKT